MIEVAIIVILVLILCVQLYLVFAKKDGSNNSELRRDISTELKNTREEINNVLGARIDNLTQVNEAKLENIRKSVEDRLTHIEKENSIKLEKMRETVDEKLTSTLEKRLGESFKQVSDQLQSVYKGLGEMQTLANGVGDLKKVLTNVKARGTWGEVQLSALLEQFLTPEQYSANVKIKKRSNDFVEFAIKIPSKVEGEIVLLPVDSKYPVEDYERLLKAEEDGDVAQIERARKDLEKSIKVFAGQIRDKYIDPPYTTDFGIMFLPTESLYCEVLRNTSLCQTLQQEYHISVTGPTTFSALINSLQMGFRTLAVQKQTSEVWNILGKVKTEFGKFGLLLDKTNRKLEEVSNTMKLASAKTRNIQNKLNKVQALPTKDDDILDTITYTTPLDSGDEGDQEE